MEYSGRKELMRTSYHNHTTWSDGSAAFDEMIDGARKAGLEEIGFSDHYALAPGNPHLAWSMKPDSLDAYVAQIQQAASATRDIAVRLGLEVDYFPQTIELTKERLARHSFDYLIGSVHFVDDFAIDLNAKPWEGLSPDLRNHIWRQYWQHLRAVAETGFFDIIGHFDLPKKFSFYPSIDLTEDALAVLDAIAAANMAIEINTSGWDKPVGEAYPAQFYLQEANRRKIPLLINSDAHNSKDVARNFDRARELAASVGYSELVRFERRKRIGYPM